MTTIVRPYQIAVSLARRSPERLFDRLQEMPEIRRRAVAGEPQIGRDQAQKHRVMGTLGAANREI